LYIPISSRLPPIVPAPDGCIINLDQTGTGRAFMTLL